MGGGKEKHKKNGKHILGYDVWGKKGVQMVLNKLAKERFDHETMITVLTDLIGIEKWDDTNFLSFESLVLAQVQHVRSNETKLSYKLLWKKYQEKKKTYKFKSTISLFGDQISSLLEIQPSFAAGGAHGLGGAGAFSVGK